jgi:hypothetical protein
MIADQAANAVAAASPTMVFLIITIILAPSVPC